MSNSNKRWEPILIQNIYPGEITWNLDEIEEKWYNLFSAPLEETWDQLNQREHKLTNPIELLVLEEMSNAYMMFKSIVYIAEYLSTQQHTDDTAVSLLIQLCIYGQNALKIQKIYDSDNEKSLNQRKQELSTLFKAMTQKYCEIWQAYQLELQAAKAYRNLLHRIKNHRPHGDESKETNRFPEVSFSLYDERICKKLTREFLKYSKQGDEKTSVVMQNVRRLFHVCMEYYPYRILAPFYFFYMFTQRSDILLGNTASDLKDSALYARFSFKKNAFPISERFVFTNLFESILHIMTAARNIRTSNFSEVISVITGTHNLVIQMPILDKNVLSQFLEPFKSSQHDKIKKDIYTVLFTQNTLQREKLSFNNMDSKPISVDFDQTTQGSFHRVQKYLKLESSEPCMIRQALSDALNVMYIDLSQIAFKSSTGYLNNPFSKEFFFSKFEQFLCQGITKSGMAIKEYPKRLNHKIFSNSKDEIVTATDISRVIADLNYQISICCLTMQNMKIFVNRSDNFTRAGFFDFLGSTLEINLGSIRDMPNNYQEICFESVFTFWCDLATSYLYDSIISGIMKGGFFIRKKRQKSPSHKKNDQLRK